MKNIERKIKNADLTDFQKKVLMAALEIPKGEVRTYLEIAKAIGKPTAYRAVGNALNKNPFAPEVPCHRVIRSNGEVGGFASGTEKKRKILIKENAIKPG